jgi:hypothetical protein
LVFFLKGTPVDPGNLYKQGSRNGSPELCEIGYKKDVIGAVDNSTALVAGVSSQEVRKWERKHYSPLF